MIYICILIESLDRPQEEEEETLWMSTTQPIKPCLILYPGTSLGLRIVVTF